MNFEQGVYTVIPTYFKDRDIDMESIFNVIRYQINNSIKNIVLLGTTSETSTLTQEDKNMIVTNVWNEFNHKINIIVGIGTNNTKTTLENAFIFREYCHAFMVTVPYYNKPSQEGIYQHFATIAQLIADKSIMIYNIPSRCGVSIEPITIANLYNNFDNIKAIKEASGSIQQTMEIIQLCQINIFSGDDALLLPLMSVGAKGVVSVASNIIPNEINNIIKLFNNGNIKEAIEINNKLFPFLKSLFVDTNPIPIKYYANKLGMVTENTVRLPLVVTTNKNILDEMDKICDDFLCDSQANIKIIYS